MTLTAGLALLVVVAVVLALAVRRLRPPARDAVPAASRALPDDVSPSLELPAPELPEADVEAVLEEPAPSEPESEPAITWTAALTAMPLDEAGRLRLIDDLALLAAPWTIALLRRAYEEEPSPQLRARVEAAFASCGEPIGTNTDDREQFFPLQNNVAGPAFRP
jgi:hypothetical protein